MSWVPGLGSEGTAGQGGKPQAQPASPGREDLPLSRAGLLVERNSHYVKVSLRGILTFVWNEDNSALVRTPTGELGRAGGSGQRR